MARPYAPAPGVAEFVLQFTSYGDEQLNILDVHHKDGTAWTATQLNAMITTIHSWWSTTGKSQCATDFSLLKIRARDLTTANGSETEQDVTEAGTATGGAAPENASLAVKKSTGLAGRGFRGRIYHVGLTKTMINGDTVLDTPAGTILASYNSLLTAINAVTNCELCIVHSQAGNTPLNPRTNTPVLVFHLADTIVDSQRRRLKGHNRHR